MKTIVVACLLLCVSLSKCEDSWTNFPDLKSLQPIVPVINTDLEVHGSERIIGGDYATIGQFPYQVAMRIDDAYFCGGSLITDSLVMTAAHCADKFSKWEVHLGAWNFTNEQEADRVIVTTNSSTVHEEWIALIVKNDIALIRLGQPVSGPNIGTVRLPSWSMVNQSFTNETVTISGWGKPTDASEGISDTLKYANVLVLSNEDCANWYGSIILPSNICTSSNNGTEATCSGDSGGPVVYYESDGLPTEIGIISFAASVGCETRFPSGHTRVTAYLDWLVTNAGVTIRP